MTEKAIKDCLLCFLFSSLSHYMFVLPCCPPPACALTSIYHVIRHHLNCRKPHQSGFAEWNADRPLLLCLNTYCGGDGEADSHKCTGCCQFADGNTSIRQQGLKKRRRTHSSRGRWCMPVSHRVSGWPAKLWVQLLLPPAPQPPPLSSPSLFHHRPLKGVQHLTAGAALTFWPPIARM